MSDYKAIEIIVNVFGKENVVDDEETTVAVIRINIAVAEITTVEEVMEEIKKRMLAIEDVL